MIKTSILIALLSICVYLPGQTPIDVAENTVKVSPSGEQSFYYGFAVGDQIIFNFEEVNGKELKELEITAVLSSSLFMEYKTKKIDRKILNVPETGIYKFRFTNSNLLTGRVCKFKIQRIPASDGSKKFEPTVYKRTIYDTTFYYVQEKFLIGSDTTMNEVLNQTVKVHSTLKAKGNKTTTNFNLPVNTIAWSYYIGVDQAGQQAYVKATKQLASKSSPPLARLVGTNPLTALALGLTSYLSQIQTGEDINYYLVHDENLNLFAADKPFRSLKKGKVVNDFAKMEPLPGTLSFCFLNDNAVSPATVIIKVAAVQVKGIWETRQVKKMKVTAKQEKYLKD